MQSGGNSDARQYLFLFASRSLPPSWIYSSRQWLLRGPTDPKGNIRIAPELRYWAGRRTYSLLPDWVIANQPCRQPEEACAPAFPEHVQAGIFASRIRSSLNRKSPHGYGRWLQALRLGVAAPHTARARLGLLKCAPRLMPSSDHGHIGCKGQPMISLVRADHSMQSSTVAPYAAAEQ